MKRMLVFALLGLVGCDKPVQGTFVTGTVAGVTLEGATAVSSSDKDLLGSSRQTIWFGDPASVCLTQRGSVTDIGAATHLGGPDGGALPALIINSRGNAWFDTGDGGERLTGTSNTRVLVADSNGKLSGRFTAKFGADEISGDFIAPPCPQAFAGCSSAPGLMGVALLALWLRRRSRQ
jgi:hypothetical protein